MPTDDPNREEYDYFHKESFKEIKAIDKVNVQIYNLEQNMIKGGQYYGFEIEETFS